MLETMRQERSPYFSALHCFGYPFLDGVVGEQHPWLKHPICAHHQPYGGQR